MTALGEAAPLGSFPLAQAAPSVRRAFVAQERACRVRDLGAPPPEPVALGSLTCQHDQPPQPATVDLTDYAPFLALWRRPGTGAFSTGRTGVRTLFGQDTHDRRGP